MIRDEYFRGLSDDQIRRAKACRTTDELFELAKAEGVSLTEDQLGAISGGNCSIDLGNDQNKDEKPDKIYS